MGEKTGISWTDHTWNPWEGCTKVSPGCANCYAEAMLKRFGKDYWGPSKQRPETKSPWKAVNDWNDKAADGVPGVLGPGTPHLVFCGSVMDWAEDRQDLAPLRERMWAKILECPYLTFLLLTKRAENLAHLLPGMMATMYPNVWVGVSVENQEWAEKRLPHFDWLPPGVIRFASYEPALGPIDWTALVKGRALIERVDWIIYGAESGPKRRPHDLQWARDTRDVCAEHGVAFFYKQGSALKPGKDALLDGVAHREFPAVVRLQSTSCGSDSGSTRA